MKREFKVVCNKENEHLVRTVVDTYKSHRAVGYSKGKGIYIRPIVVNDNDCEYTEIWFKCSKSKLGDCRFMLRELLTKGLLLSTVEIW